MASSPIRQRVLVDGAARRQIFCRRAVAFRASDPAPAIWGQALASGAWADDLVPGASTAKTPVADTPPRRLRARARAEARYPDTSHQAQCTPLCNQRYARNAKCLKSLGFAYYIIGIIGCMPWHTGLVPPKPRPPGGGGFRRGRRRRQPDTDRPDTKNPAPSTPHPHRKPRDLEKF